MRNFIIVCLLLFSGSFLVVRGQALQLGIDPIDKVIAAMTLEEKAQLLVGASNENFSGLGPTVGQTMKLVPGAAGTTVPCPRLGIPATVVADGPAGLRIEPIRKDISDTFYCTGFPVATLLASTWNTGLVCQVGKAMGNEVLEYGCDVLLGPGMNIQRNPLCGRNFEYYSEDPLLSGKMASAMVLGVQSQGVGTSIKHFAANNQETLRTKNDVRISQRALREIYLKGFEIVIKEAMPWTVMSSYNYINGTYTQEDYDLLTTILRKEWGFNGLVMTDWTGVRNTAAQVHAGNDLMMPGKSGQTKEIIEKVRCGQLAEKDVDICVRRMLEYIMKTPHFKGYKYSNHPNLKQNALITRQSAAEGMVLLKNESNTLPVVANTQNIALFGTTSYDFISGGTGSGDVNEAYVVDLMQGLQNAGLSVDDKTKLVYSKYKAYEDESLDEVNKKRGWYWGKLRAPEAVLREDFIEARAMDSKLAIITIGRNAGEGGDRQLENDFELTDAERNLVVQVCRKFHACGKKVVVILNVGGVIETQSWKHLPDAILLAWQGGQEGGNTVADILVGKVNPSGKLPTTFAADYMDYPSSKNFPINFVSSWDDEQNSLLYKKKNVGWTNYEEGIWVGYRYFSSAKKTVSYPFGYGLSYTQFEYDKAVLKPTKDGWKASVAVKNTGKTAGKEIVQLYISAPYNNSVVKPEMELRAFAKTHLLKPGEVEVVEMPFSNYDLASFVEEESAWITDAGDYIVRFASSVEDVRLQKIIKVAERKCYKVNNVLPLKNQINLLKIK